MRSIHLHAWVAYCLPCMGLGDLEQKVLDVWLVTLYVICDGGQSKVTGLLCFIRVLGC